MRIELTLKKSLIGRLPKQVKTAHALGLKKVGQTVVKEDNDAIRGMINTIAHLIETKETE
jgi:large subunit ribosomal protein L30